jgi:galactokinase
MEVAHTFETVFGQGSATSTYHCPGRVNLIGEHIDYLGGLVMPAAISLGITAQYRPSETSVIRVHSTNFQDTVEFDLGSLPVGKCGEWSDYVFGVILNLRKNGAAIGGCDILISSDLPLGSGLSSSAAMEVLFYYMLTRESGAPEPNRTEMSLDCQRIENGFIGVNCGIMDQFAVANGISDHALMLDCASLHFEPVPARLGQFDLVIINSNKPRKLTESAYNERRSECEEALRTIQRSRPIQHLVEAQIEDLNVIENVRIQNRARHAITEHQRVQTAANALRNNDLHAFGQLLNESHRSLKEDFEVSCAELDTIVSFALLTEGCLGARMTGAGFGGCCIALVKRDAVPQLQIGLTERYVTNFGYAPSFHTCKLSAGVRKIA